MKSKIIVMSLFLFSFIANSFSIPKSVELKGDLPSNPGGGLRLNVSPQVMATFILGTFDEDELELDLEFFESANNVTIEVWSNYGVRVYYETMNVANGIHAIVNIPQSNAWYYDVYIYNSNGLNVSGGFELE